MTDTQILDMWQDLNNAFCRRDAPRDTPLIVQFARALLAASEASAEPVERMETTSENIARDIREGRFPKRSEPQMVSDARPSSIEEQIMEANNEFHRPLPRVADYAALHLTPEQAAKEAK